MGGYVGKSKKDDLHTSIENTPYKKALITQSSINFHLPDSARAPSTIKKVSATQKVATNPKY